METTSNLNGRFTGYSLVLLAAILPAVTPGCAKRPENLDDFKSDILNPVTARQLHEELKDFGDRYFVTLKAASNEIADQTQDQRIRKNTLYWRLVTIPHVFRSIQQQHPLAALLDCWAFCAQSRMFFDSPDGARVFDEWTPIALEAARSLEADIEDIAQLIVKERRFSRVDSLVNEFAEKHPIKGLFARRSARPALVRASDAAGLKWFTDLPVKPFSIFLDQHAQAIREAGQTADRFTTFARMLPEILRWEVQLLLYDIEARPTVASGVASMETVSKSSARLATAAETLPEDLKSNLSELIEDVASRQELVDKTLKETQVTLDKMQATVVSVQAVADSAKGITADAIVAGEKWHATVKALDSMIQSFGDDPAEEANEATTVSAAAGPAEESRPFDIQDYTATAERTEAAATEVRAIVSDVERVLQSGTLESNAWNTVVWPGVALIVAFFTCLLLYRLMASRLAPKDPQKSPVPPRVDVARR